MDNWQAICAIVMALVSIGLFATKSEVERLRTEVYRHFVPRSDLEKVIEKLDILQALILSMKDKG